MTASPLALAFQVSDTPHNKRFLFPPFLINIIILLLLPFSRLIEISNQVHNDSIITIAVNKTRLRLLLAIR